jgi:hypothetical protein
MKGVVDGMVDKFSELQDGGRTSPSDKFQALSHLEFKKTIPPILDNDPDLDGHDLKFDTMLSCYAFGGKKPRDIDRLNMYSSGFKEGSTRKKVYDNAVRKAIKDARIPAEAGEVLNEIRIELRTYIWETKLQKMTRLDKEFESLEQGGMTHSDFRALFESKLQDMDDSPMDMPTVQTLYRKYLTKIAPTLRAQVLSKEWKIDGEDKPARAPSTYKEVAKACGLILEEKADIYAAGQTQYDGIMIVEHGSQQLSSAAFGRKTKGQNQVQCSYCSALDSHHSVVCPQKAADVRGEGKACLARATQT